MKRMIVAAVLLGLLWPLAVDAQATRALTPRERRDQIGAAGRLIVEGKSLYARGDFAGTELRLERARVILESLESSHAPYEDEELDWLWTCYTHLGYVHRAAALYDRVTPIQQERWMNDWQDMQAGYGSITLASPSEVRTDPTLSISRLEIRTPRGGREFPEDLVRSRAASEIRLAFEEKYLVTDPIVVPVGTSRLIFHLDRESALNYEDPLHTVDFDVRSGESREVQVNPQRRSVPKALLGALGAVLITPFLIAG